MQVFDRQQLNIVIYFGTPVLLIRREGSQSSYLRRVAPHLLVAYATPT